MKKSNVYIHYVDNSTPLLKKFKTLKAAQAFATKFKKANPDPMDGFWVDFIVIGEVIPVDPEYVRMV